MRAAHKQKPIESPNGQLSDSPAAEQPVNEQTNAKAAETSKPSKLPIWE
jgi:hypothetical protein